MAYTLSNLLVDVYDNLGQLNTSLVTSGTTTTIVDSVVGGLGKYGNNDFQGGTAIVIYDAGGENAAPEGQFARIASSVGTSGTLTLQDALTAAVAAADEYAWTTSRYPLRDMIRLCNKGLQALGDLPNVDTTTLDSAANKTEYAQSVDWKRETLRIDIQGRTDDANDNRWHTVWDWERTPAAPAATALLIFPEQFAYPYGLRIWYMAPHGLLRTYGNTVSEYIHPELAKWAVTLAALQWMNGRTGGRQRGVLQDLNNAKVELERVKADYKIWKPRDRKSVFTLQTAKVENFRTPTV
jgi:hypothetical protein